MEPIFFTSPQDLREWFLANHKSAAELLVGYHRKATGLPTLTWSDSVDEALCFGWIDGIRRRLADTSYTIRFTPRRKGSVWSAVNLRKIEELTARGLMRPAGLRVSAERDAVKHPGYSYERTALELDPTSQACLRSNPAAWAFHEARPPGYRRRASLWVMSARQPATRSRRLAQLIGDAAAGRRLAALTSPPRGGANA